MHTLSLGTERPPKKLLCLGAHCDDIEIGCGGTLLALLASYPSLAVDWVIFSGAGRREAEARASAAEFLGGRPQSRVLVHDFRDSYFPGDLVRIKECFAALASTTAPDLILTHHRQDLHQDHRTIGELTWQTFRNRLIWEYEIPKFDGDLGRPNLFVPLTPAQAERKIEVILRSFPSQAGKAWFCAETFAALLRLRGIEAGASSGRAEAFHVAKTVVRV